LILSFISPVGRSKFDLALGFTQALPVQKRQAPSTLVALPSDMLFAHAMPYNVIVSQCSPSGRYLGSAAERGGVEITQNFEGKLSGESCQVIDSDQFADAGRDEG
jgi:hypothetical protein